MIRKATSPSKSKKLAKSVGEGLDKTFINPELIIPFNGFSILCYH